MNSPPAPEGTPDELSREERLAALFANLVIQQTNTALILLGQIPNPETGEQIQDLEAAKLFIDQLEMLEVKTKGNLDKREEQLLRQSLTTLRMSFVRAVESAGAQAEPPPLASKGAANRSEAGSEATPGPPLAADPSPPDQEESRKKFSKKY